jgi:hypothetical protein
MEVYQMSIYWIAELLEEVDVRDDDPDSIPFDEMVYDFLGRPDCPLGRTAEAITAEGIQLPEGKRLRDYSEAERQLLETARREHADKVRDQADEFMLLVCLEPGYPN